MHSNVRVRVLKRKLVKPRLNVTYPFVTDMGSQLTQIYINKMFRALVDQMILDQGFWQEPNMTITGDFKVRLNQRGLLSVTQEIYSYVKLAAHGLTVQKSLTFDLLSGQQLILKDLFKWDSDYKAYLSQIIKQQIKERDIPLLTEFKSINDDQDFYLTPDNLVIYFQLYEYTPYVYGILEFKIPYQQLKPIIGKDSPLNRLLKP